MGSSWSWIQFLRSKNIITHDQKCDRGDGGVVVEEGNVTLKLSSMVLRVVEVLMLQVPASSVMSIWGVDTVAAFLNRKLTSRA